MDTPTFDAVDQDNNRFLDRAKWLVAVEYNENSTDIFPLRPEDFYVVWFSKVLDNWKALVSTDKASGLYYEVTHNGTKGETYVDTYSKLKNTAYPTN